MDKIKSYLLSIMKDERTSPEAYIIRALLSIASVAYLILLRCVRFLYKIKILPSYKVTPKVISVGNITLGGTGKTPFAIKVAEDVKAMGRKPAVLNRGYGDDEFHLLEEILKEIPVLIGRDRVKNAKKAYAELGSDCVVLDDGFQHYRLKRDLDIVLIDATSPFGNMKLFPRGILREPLTRLKEADFAVLTKSDMGRDKVPPIRELLRRLNAKIEIAESFYKPVCLTKIFAPLEMSKTPDQKAISLTCPVRKKFSNGVGFAEETVPLSYLGGKRIAILAGIANPDYFEWMAGNIGAEIGERFYYPDHHSYTEKDASHIAERCLAKGINLAVTTEKDAVRLKRLRAVPSQIEILALKIDFSISSNEEALVGRLCSLFNR